MSDKARFAKNLRLLREAAELTQAQLAEAIGKSRGSVIAWEDPDRPTMPSEGDLGIVAAALHTTRAELRYGEVIARRPAIHERLQERTGGSVLPRQLELMALDFEREALQAGASETLMRYIRSSLRNPDLAALFGGGPDESPMTAEEAGKEMRAVIRELRSMLTRWLKREDAQPGRTVPGE